MFQFLAAKFSGKLAKSLIALWTKDIGIFEVVTDLGADFLEQKLNDHQKTRKAERFFQEVEDEVFESIQAYVNAEFRNIRQGDINIAIEDALEFSCSPDFLKLCIEFGFRLDNIILQYMDRHKNRPTGLSIDHNVYFSLGKHVIAKVITSVGAFPKFSTEALKGILEDTSEILDRMNRIELMIDEIHSLTAKPKTANDVLYKNAIENKFGKINIFGVDTTGLPKRYDLSLAYVNLTITGRDFKENEPSQKVISLALKNPKPLTLVVGEPGSGKTTLMSWLAVSLTRRSLPAPLTYLNAYFPIFVRLRDFAGKEFPSGIEIATSSLGIHGSKIDAKWLLETLRNKKILFLFDGYDELPAECRARAENWISDVLSTWDEAKAIITSRPYAADELKSLVSEYGKPNRDLIVEPMNLEQVGSLISRWYKAYEYQASHNKEADLEDLGILKSRLIKQVFSKRVLRSIIRNPLICSLLCFVNTDRKGIVPSDRGELYKIATSALVTRRDTERGIDLPDKMELPERQRIRILSIIAEYFYQRKSFQLKFEDVEERLFEYLPALGVDSGRAGEILNFLAQRSHVLRSPSAHMLDFSHKTFQEYFFAIRLVEKGMVEYVRDAFVDPDYEVVCSFVMSLATPDFADNLVGELIESLEVMTAHDRRRTLLLLQGSIGDIAEMSPDLRVKVQGFLSEVIPPRSMREAEDLASTGPLLVEPLSVFSDLEHADVWPYCVATLINSMELDALYALQKYAELGDPVIDKQIVTGKALFPRAEYSRIVLSHCRTLREFEVSSLGDLEIAKRLPNLHTLVLRSGISDRDISQIKFSSTPSHLVIQKDVKIRSLDFLKETPSVRILEIYGGDTLASQEFDTIASLKSLEHLKIHSPALENLNFVQSLPRLEFIDLAESLNFSDLGPLKKSNSLHDFVLPYSWMYDEFDSSVGDYDVELILEKARDEGELFFDFIGDIDEYDERELISDQIQSAAHMFDDEEYWEPSGNGSYT